jgi:magnesium chelatase family protein
VARRVADAWERRRGRQATDPTGARSRLDASAGLSPRLRTELEHRSRRFGLSARRAQATADVARTIADLDDSDAVTAEHLREALAYRPQEPAA